MNAADICFAIGEQYGEWALIEGCVIKHIERGDGLIERVEQRDGYAPLFQIRFAAVAVTFTPKSFENRKSTILPSPLALARIEALQKARIEAECSIQLKEEQARLLSEEARKEKERLMELYAEEQRLRSERYAKINEIAREEERQRSEKLAAMREEARLRKEYIATLSLSERHKLFLEKHGIVYRGVRERTQRFLVRRITHCYSCKLDLDNAVDLECVACGWILCTCGACGCGFDRNRVV